MNAPLGIMLALLGYTLVYAATANHGRFATQPWAGITGDAYADVNADTGTNIGGNVGPKVAP